MSGVLLISRKKCNAIYGNFNRKCYIMRVQLSSLINTVFLCGLFVASATRFEELREK